MFFCGEPRVCCDKTQLGRVGLPLDPETCDISQTYAVRLDILYWRQRGQPILKFRSARLASNRFLRSCLLPLNAPVLIVRIY